MFLTLKENYMTIVSNIFNSRFIGCSIVINGTNMLFISYTKLSMFTKFFVKFYLKCYAYDNSRCLYNFRDMLKKGSSQHWKKTLSKFTDGKSKKLDPEPILEYFEPLLKWLKKKNKNEHIGWKSKNPMECPES